MFKKLAFVASTHPRSQQVLSSLEAAHPKYLLEQADCIVVIGGDGFMLHTLHQHRHLNKPFYGINTGNVGFLMNATVVDDLHQKLREAKETILHPLRVVAKDTKGKHHTLYAINEVSLLRHTSQAAKIAIEIDGIERLDELVCDGVLVSTPAGSTAYNLSAHGPIIPIGTKLLALTPISPFRPRRWRGALLPDSVKIVFRVTSPDSRPVNAAADHQMVEDIVEAQIEQDLSLGYRLLFAPDHNLEDRIVREQFLP